MNPDVLSQNQEKVAWAWLDKLLNQSKGRENLAPAMEMTRQNREKLLQEGYERVLKGIKQVIRREIGPVQRMEAQLARRAGIDPLYLNWFIVRGRNWPSMSRDADRALRAIQNMYLWYGAVPDHWNNKIIPDLEDFKHRDKALKDLAQWFLRVVVPRVRKWLVREIWKESQDLVKAFKGKNAPRDPIAAKLFMRNWKTRLVADAFQLQPAVQSVVDLLD